MREEITVCTKKDGWAVISDRVCNIVSESGVKNGICNVFLPHSTASLVATSHWDERGIEDAMEQLKRAIPPRTNYTAQDSPFTSAARSRNALTGSSLTFIVRDGQLLRGGSQAIILLEYDGPQERTVTVTVLEKDFHYAKLEFTTWQDAVIDLEERIAGAAAQTGIREGLCHISNPSSTSALALCSREAARDIYDDLERLVPARGDFKHRETASDAAGHIRSAIMGTQLHLPISDGKLVKADDTGIYYMEFDGPRYRNVSLAFYAGEGGAKNE